MERNTSADSVVGFRLMPTYSSTPKKYLVHMDVVVMVTVIYGFDETLELSYGTAMDHENESHSDGVLHIGQAVVQLANSLNWV